MKLGSADARAAARRRKSKLYTINSPVDDEKSLASGTADAGQLARTILADIRVDDERPRGAAVQRGRRRGRDHDARRTTRPAPTSDDIRAVRIDDARGVIAAAEKKMAQTDAPDATRLPVEAEPLFPDDPLREAARARKGILTPYRVAAEDFDVSLITPLLHVRRARQRGGADDGTRARTGGARRRSRWKRPGGRCRISATGGTTCAAIRRSLMIRATPKMVESFWKTVLRGAAQTQGVSLPAIKQHQGRLRPDAGLLRRRRGDARSIRSRSSIASAAADAVYEGFYVVRSGGDRPAAAAR